MSFGVIGDPPRDLPTGPEPKQKDLSAVVETPGPMLGDLSRCSPSIVAPIMTPDPKTALMLVMRSCDASDKDWTVIKLVRNDVTQLLAEDDVHVFAKALLVVRGVASTAKPESEVAIALRPLETSLAEAVGKRAHKMALEQGWRDTDGYRGTVIRGRE